MKKEYNKPVIKNIIAWGKHRITILSKPNEEKCKTETKVA